MKRGWVGVVAVAIAAIAIVAYKELSRPPIRSATPEQVPGPAVTARPSVFLYADPQEVDEVPGCGEIIRAVRAAAARGVATQEVAPGSENESLRRYRVLVEPTVLILDGQGRVVTRHEGESSKTIDAIRRDLERLGAIRP